MTDTTSTTGSPRPVSARRTSCDERKRDAGQVRVSLWLPAAAVAAAERLAARYGADRGQLIEAAIAQFDLHAQAGLDFIGVPAWTADGLAQQGEDRSAIAVSLPPAVVARIMEAGAAVGLDSPAKAVEKAAHHLAKQLAGGAKFTAKG